MSSAHARSLAISLIGFAVALGASSMVVSIDHPTFLEPAVGEVEVEVSIEARATVARVALWVDDRPHAILEAPPFRWIVDVGGENSEHTFRVVATDIEGEKAEATLTTPRLAADDYVDLELQQLYVTVLRDGSIVQDLPESAFSVEDRGEPQELVTFERGEVPLTGIVLLDVSSSMGGDELELALSSARTFVNGLEALDQAKLLLFSDRVVRSTQFTGFREVLIAGLSRVEASGPTALNDHLYMSLKLLERRQGRRVVLLLSDGIDSASVLEMKDVLAVAERSPSIVYWLRLPAPGPRVSSAWRHAEGYRRELARLEELVAISGGRILDLAGVAEAAAAFEEVLEELRGQYVLGYYPTNRSDDGSWHPVRVRVAGAGLKVRTRRGYIDF